jgi:hypothetical protein
MISTMILIEYKTRPKIIQMQMDDYLYEFNTHYYPMWVQKSYQKARKLFSHWIPVRPHKKKQIKPKKQAYKSILDYFPKYIQISLPKARYLRRFRSIPCYSYEDFAVNNISEQEWDLMQLLPEFTGFFNHIFELNDLSFFDDLQEQLEIQKKKFKGIFLYDIVALSLFQRFLGIESYSELERLSYFLRQHPLLGIVHDSLFFPTAKDLSYILNLLPIQGIYEYFFSLIDELIDIKAIIPRILVWDGQFVRSNCNNNFKDANHKAIKQYNDPEAGYHRHNGQHKGVGYEISNLYCYCGSWDRAFPVYFEVFPGNKSENPIFRETLDHFLQLPIGQGWKFIILDTGGYSEENIQFCLKRGIYPLIRAKKNIKSHPTKELRKGYWFRTDFIPIGWTEQDLVQTYKIRPVIEAGQAANNFFYKTRRMNTRGLENAIRSRGLNYIFDLLRTLTAVKLNRTDLISKLNSFSTNRVFMGETGWMKAAKQANFDIFYYPSLTPFQKRFWDKRRSKKEKLNGNDDIEKS